MAQGTYFPGGPVAKTMCSKAGGTGLIPGQESKIPHAAAETSQASTKSSHVTAKTQCSQINKEMFFVFFFF